MITRSKQVDFSLEKKAIFLQICKILAQEYSQCLDCPLLGKYRTVDCLRETLFLFYCEDGLSYQTLIKIACRYFASKFLRVMDDTSCKNIGVTRKFLGPYFLPCYL